ncbi:transposase [Rhodococcus sp. WAY2]|nr:transposase [Rhodococcus sp. WAY2]
MAHLPDDATAEQAQRRVDEFRRLRGDTRMPATADGKASAATVAAAEP